MYLSYVQQILIKSTYTPVNILQECGPPPSGKNSAVRQKIGGKSLKLVIFNRNFMSSSIQFCIKIGVFVKIFLKIWLAKTWHHTCLKANCKPFYNFEEDILVTCVIIKHAEYALSEQNGSRLLVNI